MTAYSFAQPDLPDAASRLAELEPSDRLVISAVRAWVAVRSGHTAFWDGSVAAFSRELGPARAQRALASLVRMVGAIAVHAWRTLEVHHPCCPCVGEDEMDIVNLLTAVRARDANESYRQALRLVEREGVTQLLGQAQGLARTLDGDGSQKPTAAADPLDTASEASGSGWRPAHQTLH